MPTEPRGTRRGASLPCLPSDGTFETFCLTLGRGQSHDFLSSVSAKLGRPPGRNPPLDVRLFPADPPSCQLVGGRKPPPRHGGVDRSPSQAGSLADLFELQIALFAHSWAPMIGNMPLRGYQFCMVTHGATLQTCELFGKSLESLGSGTGISAQIRRRALREPASQTRRQPVVVHRGMAVVATEEPGSESPLGGFPSLSLESAGAIWYGEWGHEGRASFAWARTFMRLSPGGGLLSSDMLESCKGQLGNAVRAQE
jgi:hypothetical protein